MNQLTPEQLIMVLNALPDPVFLLTEDGFYAGLYGHSDPAYYHNGHKLVGASLYDVLPKEVADSVMEHITASLDQNRLIKVEYPLSAEQVKGLEDQAGPQGMLWFEGHIQPFPSSVDGRRAVIWVARNITQRKQLEEALRKASQVDPLTGAYNRRKLMEALEEHFNEFQRYRHPVSAVMFDIDYFKQLNDRFGHLVGDQVLHVLSETCQNLLRKTDLLARFGGEEFVILLPNTHASEAMRTAERIQTEIPEEITRRIGRDKTITLSLGVTQLFGDDNHYESLIHRADEALYQAKRNGRNCIVQQ